MTPITGEPVAVPTLEGRVIAGVRWSGSASVAMGLIGLLQLVVLARLLGPTAFGLMALAVLVVELGAVFGNLGLSEAVIQRKKPTRNELSSLYWLTVALGTMAAVAIVLAAPWLARLFGVPELAALLPIVSLKLWLDGLGIQFKALLKKHLEFRILSITDVVGAAVGFVVAVVSAAVFDQGVWSLVWGVLGTTVVQTAVYNWYGWLARERPRLHFTRRDLDGYLRFGSYRAGATLLSFVNKRVDQALIGGLMGPHVLGLYTVAFNMSKQPVARLLPIVSRVAFPALSVVQDDPERLRHGYLRMLAGLTFVLAPMLVGLAAVAPVAVPLFFGEEWVQAVPLVQILAFVALLTAFASVSKSLTNATGHVTWDFYWNLASALLLPPVILLAARTGDPAAVALSLLAVQAGLFVAGYHLRLRRIVGPFMKDLARTAGAPLIGALLMGILVAWAGGLVSALPQAVQLAALVTLGAVTYVASTFLLDRDQLLGLMALVLRGEGSRTDPTPLSTGAEP